MNKNAKVIVVVSKLIGEKALKNLRKEFNTSFVVLPESADNTVKNSGNETKLLEDTLNGMGVRCQLGAEAKHEFFVVGSREEFIKLAEEKLGKMPHYAESIKK